MSAPSFAVTVIALLPEINATLQDQLAVPVAVVVMPVAAFVHVTCVTPTASEVAPPSATGVLAVACVAALVGAVIVTAGLVVSGGVYVTVIVSVAALFAASFAVTVIALLPALRATLQDQLVVPVAVVVTPVAAFVHVTCVTPTVSDALPPRVTGVLEIACVAALAGAVIVIAGLVVSGGV